MARGVRPQQDQESKEQDARETKGKAAGISNVQVQSRTREGSGKASMQHDQGSDDTGTQLDQTPWKLLIAVLLIAPLLPHAPPKVRLRLRTPVYLHSYQLLRVSY